MAGCGVEDLVDALGGSGGLLAQGEYVAQRLDRPDQLETSAMKATRPPVVRWAALTAKTPSSKISAIAMFGTRSRLAQNAPRSLALDTWVP